MRVLANRLVRGPSAFRYISCLPTDLLTVTMPTQLCDNPDTPCIGVCSTLFDEVCKGCGRTAQEVTDWIGMSNSQKSVIWARITQEGTAIRFRK